MSSESDPRSQLIDAVSSAGRELSTWTVLFHEAIAERVGLNASDQRALDLLLKTGPISAGRLAELTGMTTGAITKVTDRLERAGFVRRLPDPRDRRKVIIQVELEYTGRTFGPLFASMGQSFRELCAPYTIEELTIIHGFMLQAMENLQKQIRLVRSSRSTKRNDSARSSEERVGR